VLLQVAVGLKMLSLAGAGAAAAAAGVQALGARITAMSAASAAAGGGLAGLKAAFLSLGMAARASIVVAGIAATVLVLQKLSDMGRDAPPNVDRLTTSLGQLGRTGKVTGEAADHFGKDFGKLHDQINKVVNPSVVESINNWGAKVTGGLLDSGDATETFTKNMDAIDQSLVSLVKGGNADLAKAALNSMTKGMSPEAAKKFKDELDGYPSVLADIALEQQLTADSMGFFGEAALATSAKLEAQQRSADGLRQSILALNDVNRSAYEAQIGFEASLDSLTESFKEHGSTLNLDTEAGRANGQAMAEAAKAQGELIATGLAAGESLGSMTTKSNELRASMLTLATEAFDGNKAKATEYVNTLLGVPSDIATLVKLEREEAVAGLQTVQAAITATPGVKEVRVDALNAAAIAALEKVGLKTRTLPDGRTAVYTANGQALGSISSVWGALNNLNGKTANTYTTHHVLYEYAVASGQINGRTSKQMGRADGGRVPRYADGDRVQVAPNGLLRGPGSGRSDDILALFASGAVGKVSTTEYVVNAKSTEKYLPLLEAINQNKIPGFASGGLTSGQLKGLSAPSDMSGLTSTLADVRTRIKDKTGGRTESRLLNILDAVGKKLIAHERALTSVNASLSKAKDKLKDLTSASAQMATGIKSNILSSASITRGASGDAPTTVRSIMSGLTASRDKASAFSGALSGLRSKGLSPALLQQIAEAGIEGGGLETAGALMSASSSEIGSINSLQSQINSSASSAGRTTADHMYATAIKQQTVSVNKLQASQDRLERTMAALAKSLDKTLGKTLGRKAAGGIVGAAAAGGIRSSLTWVGEQGPELLDLPSGSRVWSNADSRRKADAPWSSMLNTPRRGAAGGGTAGPQEVRVVVELRGTSNSKYEEFLLSELRSAINARGGNAQVVLTGRRQP
jgi:hypothetical protein